MQAQATEFSGYARQSCCFFSETFFLEFSHDEVSDDGYADDYG
jgi:hypothetical protein